MNFKALVEVLQSILQSYQLKIPHALLLELAESFFADIFGDIFG